LEDARFHRWLIFRVREISKSEFSGLISLLINVHIDVP